MQMSELPDKDEGIRISPSQFIFTLEEYFTSYFRLLVITFLPFH